MLEGHSGSPNTGCDQLSARIEHVPIVFFSRRRECDHDLHAPVESDWKRGTESSGFPDIRATYLAAIPGCGKKICRDARASMVRTSGRSQVHLVIWSLWLIWFKQIIETGHTNQTDRTDHMNKTGWRNFSASCEWNYADPYSTPPGLVDIIERSLDRHENHRKICGPVSGNMPVGILRGKK